MLETTPNPNKQLVYDHPAGEQPVLDSKLAFAIIGDAWAAEFPSPTSIATRTKILHNIEFTSISLQSDGFEPGVAARSKLFLARN